MRTTTFRSSWVFAFTVGASLAPTVVRAQIATPAAAARPQGGTHTVRAGDTLWDLARRFLSDPFLWPEIYRLNTDVVEDPHWIYPGETLRLPGAAAPAPVVAAAPAPTNVFARPQAAVRPPRQAGGVARGVRPSVRAGEVMSAPYVDRVGGPAGAGRVVAAADISGAHEMGQRSRFNLDDRIYVKLPEGSESSVGAQYLTYELGPALPSGGQVVIPTGVVQIERVGGREASTARVVHAYGAVLLDQGLLPMDSIRIISTADAAAVETGPDAKVVYLQGDHVLPSLQQFLVLSANDGVKAGDQFTLFRAAHATPRGDALPDEVVGVAQVLRVTPFGASAVVIHQSQPAIAMGMPARLTARMP